MVINANPSVTLEPWLVGDSFSYVCNGALQINGDNINTCFEQSDAATWSLSLSSSNLPICGELSAFFSTCEFVKIFYAVKIVLQFALYFYE